ncbi:unnamed protein product [Protopolystoma xenopodis]|uniref:Uncharacterized protein n=1 Tax=Protopolystoma xenopodis TaxID=117903 RepID=A0A448X1J5_9PLAT|nr:unnamed protein product [Protopolystoma xenopodis]
MPYLMPPIIGNEIDEFVDRERSGTLSVGTGERLKPGKFSNPNQKVDRVSGFTKSYTGC